MYGFNLTSSSKNVFTNSAQHLGIVVKNVVQHVFVVPDFVQHSLGRGSPQTACCTTFGTTNTCCTNYLMNPINGINPIEPYKTL